MISGIRHNPPSNASLTTAIKIIWFAPQKEDCKDKNAEIPGHLTEKSA